MMSIAIHNHEFWKLLRQQFPRLPTLARRVRNKCNERDIPVSGIASRNTCNDLLDLR